MHHVSRSMTARPVRRPLPTALALAIGALGLIGALALAPAIARADSLVYVKGGAVYAAQADGSQARAITSAGNGWAWPSETDAGIIAAAGGLARVSGGFDPSGGDEIYELDQQGRLLRGPIATQGTYSTASDPEYVSHFRVAPDNSNVAWTDFSAAAGAITSWRRADGSGSFSTANDAQFGGPLNFSSPEWWGPGQLLFTHDGVAGSGQSEYGIYSVSTGPWAYGWGNDLAIGNATSYQVAMSHSGLVFAVLTDDGADNAGTIKNISIQLETTAAAATPNGVSNVTPTGCSITLPASQFATLHGSSEASMSFSSDGSTLAWGQDDGVYEANVSNPSNCAGVTSSVHRVVAGGAMPFLGAAALGPAAGPPNATLGKLKLVKSKRQATFTFHGSGGVGAMTFKCKLDRGRWTGCRSPQTYKHLKRGKHKFAVEAIDSRGRVDPTPATRSFKVS